MQLLAKSTTTFLLFFFVGLMSSSLCRSMLSRSSLLLGTAAAFGRTTRNNGRRATEAITKQQRGGRVLLSSSSPRTLKRSRLLIQLAASRKSPPMSYEVDSDEDAEQHLGTSHNHHQSTTQQQQPTSITTTSADESNDNLHTAAALPTISQPHDDDYTTKTSTSHRYSNLLRSVGIPLEKIPAAGELPACRPISSRDVFCNRELKLGAIKAVGFDMDYTVAQYRQPAFDRLAFDGAKRKLVDNFGYPPAVLDFTYDHEFWTRGLIIDTLRGNFLKIDRHKYVRVAYHGFDCMSSTTRKHLYSRTFNKVMSFSEKHFVNVDTLFQLVDAHLFAHLIQLKDKGEYESLDLKTYEEMYKQVRECVDLCHRDGVIKDEVARHPHKYIVLDDQLIPMLEQYRAAGVKLFLLTNSYWEYTSTVMNYLFHRTSDISPELYRQNTWMELFDLIVVGSCKPAYMLDPYLNLFRISPADGTLRNTDGIHEIRALPGGAREFLSQGKVFQGGNWLHLHAMLEIEAGEEILYVGDHLYSDVLRSKRTLGWRSAFVVPELEQEMKVFAQTAELAEQITQLRQLRDELSERGEQLLQQKRRQQHSVDATDDKGVEEALARLEEQDTILKRKLAGMAETWHAAFHPVWGAMFNAGYQDSRFAFYVANYACVYTSRASNLGRAAASTLRSFRTGSEMLPHDRLLASSTSCLVE